MGGPPRRCLTQTGKSNDRWARAPAAILPSLVKHAAPNACGIFGCSMHSIHVAAAACAGSRGDARCMHMCEPTHRDRVMHPWVYQLLNAYGCRGMCRRPGRREGHSHTGAHSPQSIGRCILWLQHLLKSCGCCGMRRRPKQRAAHTAEATGGAFTRARPLTSINRVLRQWAQHRLASYGCRGTSGQQRRRAAADAACGLCERAPINLDRSRVAPLGVARTIVCCIRWCITYSIRMAAATCAGGRGDARGIPTREPTHHNRSGAASFGCSIYSKCAAAAACAGGRSDARLIQPRRRAVHSLRSIACRTFGRSTYDRMLHTLVHHLLNSYGCRDMCRRPRRRISQRWRYSCAASARGARPRVKAGGPVVDAGFAVVVGGMHARARALDLQALRSGA